MTYKKRISFGVVIAVLAFGFNSYAYINSNHGGSAYQGSGDGLSSFGITLTIDDYIIIGASAFLKAHSTVQEILRIYELQDMEGIDYIRLSELTANAVQEMQKTVDAYNALVSKASATPYNPVVLLRLILLDYDGFLQDYDLNPSAFNEVAFFLKRGDVTGLFQHTLTNYELILSMLESVNNSISDG